MFDSNQVSMPFFAYCLPAGGVAYSILPTESLIPHLYSLIVRKVYFRYA